MNGSKLLTVLLAVCAAGTAASAELTLVRDGAPCSVIVIGTRPTTAAQLAAYELQHVIQLMTGATVPIAENAGKTPSVNIMVGASEAASALGVPDKTFAGEEYLVKFSENNIFLMGNDSPDYRKVDYNDPKTFPPQLYTYKSTTYAVYDFLEKCCGVRFYSFGDVGIAYGKRLTLKVNAIDIRRAPAMDAFRRPYFGSKTRHLSERDNDLLQLRWRTNALFAETNHSIYGIVYRYWGKALSPNLARLFIEKRPEYFAKGYEGKSGPSALKRQYPNDPDLPPQLCTSSEGTVEYFADEAAKVFRGERVEGAPFGNLPRMQGKPFYYPVQEDDSGAWCKCDECAKARKRLGSYNQIHFDWVNRIAVAAAKKVPGLGISTLAYSDSLAYPKNTRLEPNVAIQICLGIQSWYHPGIYARQHNAYKEWVKNEVKKRPVTIWVYLLCPSHEAKIIYKYNKFFPVLYPRHAGKYFKEFVSDGIRGWFGEIDPAFHLPEAYVATKLSDDPSLDPDEIIDEYFALYYGAAGDAMKEFTRKVEDITWTPANYKPEVLRRMPGSSFTYGLHGERDNWHLGTPARIADLQKSVDEAVKRASTPEEKARVKAFVDTIWQQTVDGRKDFEQRERVRAVPIPEITFDYAGECGGDLSKVDFSKATRSSPWTTLHNEKIDNPPMASFASDSKYFYMRYQEAGSAAADNLSHGMWLNGLEMFFAVNPDSSDYFQIAIAPDAKFESHQSVVVEGVKRLQTFDAKPIINSKADATGWTLELAIPLASLVKEGVKSGDAFYGNFLRTRRFGQDKSWTWSAIFSEEYAAGLYRMGKLIAAPISHSGELNACTPLKPAKTGTLPEGWSQNKGKGFEPLGSAEIKDGVLKMKSAGKDMHLFHNLYVNANRGDLLTIELAAKGSGSAACGAYLYHWKGNGAGTTVRTIAVSPEWKIYKQAFVIANVQKGRPVMSLRPVLGASAGSEIEIRDLKVTLTPRAQSR